MQGAIGFHEARAHVERVRRRLGDKAAHELAFWLQWRAGRGARPPPPLGFRWLVEDHFGVSVGSLSGRRILDVGCGPTDSLAWLTRAAERIGLDPLATEYRSLGIDETAMTYVDAGAEAMPFPDRHFDLITAFDSLDHVDDLERTVAEIQRVAAPGARLLIVTDVLHTPTPAGPIGLDWDVVKGFEPGFATVSEHHFERTEGVHASIRARRPYDHADPRARPGVLSALLVKLPRGP